MLMKNVEIGKTCMEYTIGKETLRLENMVGSVVTTDQVINTKARVEDLKIKKIVFAMAKK